MSYCAVIGRLEWRHVILDLAGNSFHGRSRTASDTTCKLGITFVDESKDTLLAESLRSFLDKSGKRKIEGDSVRRVVKRFLRGKIWSE